jgi:hypothetical protein
MKKIIFLLIAIPFALVSCKKAQDEVMPTIGIISPANGSLANVYDTLHVRIHVSDDRRLESMHVQLVTTQMTPVLPSISIPVSGKSHDAVFDYVISNFRMPSGSYYLAVDASDGYNLARSYSNIYVTGVPRALNGFFAATAPMPGTLSIYKGDTSSTASLFSSYTSDFTDMAVSDYWQQVYTNGIFTGPLKATSIDGATSGFSIPSIAGPSPYWGPMSVKGTKLWVAYHALAVFKALDFDATPRFNSPADGNYFPGLTLQSGERLYTVQKDISNANPRMVLYSTAGGGIQESPIAVDPVAMFEKNADEIYVLGNAGGQGQLLIYDFATNGFWQPVSLPAGTVTAATQIDSNTVLIGMSNGNVYTFTYAPVGLLTWATGINPTALRYDDVNDEVYSAEGTNVKVYGFSPFTLQQTVVIPYPVMDLELWFNL